MSMTQQEREYDGMELLAHELATLRAEDLATINDLRKELQEAVKRMEAVSQTELQRVWANAHRTHLTPCINAVRARLIQAAKGECQTCGGSKMTAGWYPTYNDPDNSGMHPEAEPCPDCQPLAKGEP
jgi:hypothetical protein